MPMQCSKCSYLVSVPAGEKRPPWCPRCGADVKEAAPVLVGAVAGAFGVPRQDVATHTDADIAAQPVDPAADSAPPAFDGLEFGPVSPGEVFRTRLYWHALAWGPAIVSFGIVAIALGHILHPGRRPAQAGAYGCAGLFAVAGLVAAYVGFRFAGQKYQVFPNHLVEWQLFAPTTVRWEDIREVFHVAHPAWIHFRVAARNGRAFTLRGDIKDHKRLGEWIAARAAAARFDEVWQELMAGRDVRFGPLSVNRGGVVVNGQIEPWHRIGLLTFGLNPNPKRGTSLVSNMTHLRLGGAWVELSEIPNYRLFEELARRLFPACVPA